MNRLWLSIGLAAVVGLMACPPLAAKERSATTASHKARKAKAPKTPVNLGYGETRAERDRRLLRECQGKPNAGACEGYAH